MIAVLKDNEKQDLETKETCEANRMKDTKDAIDMGRAIDDMTDEMTQLTHEIKTLEEEIEKHTEERKQVQEELDKATEIRKRQNEDFKVTDKEDEEAAATVKDAREVLKKLCRGLQADPGSQRQ